MATRIPVVAAEPMAAKRLADLPLEAAIDLADAAGSIALPTLSFVPIAPVRVFDSRFAGFGGSINQGSPRTIDVKDAIDVVTGAVSTPNAIPQGAKAVAFNLAVTGTSSAGYVAVIPGTGTTVTDSTVNWTGSGYRSP